MINLPMAAEGFESYRYYGPYGYIMIGANSDAEALQEANRSLRVGPANLDLLEKYCTATSKYCQVVPL